MMVSASGRVEVGTGALRTVLRELLVGLLAAACVAGCGRGRALAGKSLSPEGDEAAAIKELVEQATALIEAGQHKRVERLMKQGLPKVEQATIMGTVKKVAEADSWQIEEVERFGKSYFRATLRFGGREGEGVTVNVLREDDRFVLTGGG